MQMCRPTSVEHGICFTSPRTRECAASRSKFRSESIKIKVPSSMTLETLAKVKSAMVKVGEDGYTWMLLLCTHKRITTMTVHSVLEVWWWWWW
jgi:hypothetical protein